MTPNKLAPRLNIVISQPKFEAFDDYLDSKSGTMDGQMIEKMPFDKSVNATR